MLRLLTPDLPWESIRDNPGDNQNIIQDAWDLLDQDEALAEEDKTEWEYNLDLMLKIMFLLGITIQTDWSGKENYLMPFSYTAASFLNPLIGIANRLCISAPHFMPSGHFWTLKGNTAGHKLMVLSFKQKKQLEGDEKRALLWYDSVLLQGDDFLSRNIFREEYSTFVDKKWGCITKRKFGRPREVRFLQRELKMVDGFPIFAYDEQRAAIKVSIPRPEITDHAEALKAAVLTTGSERLRRILRPIYMDMKVPRIHVTYNDRCTDAAFFDQGVLKAFWTPNERLGKEVGTYFALGHRFGCSPEYFDSVIRRARQAGK